jgi:uncharacterized spore protein YtfJ
MADRNTFDSSVKALLDGLDGFVSTKTVVGTAQTVNDCTIIPFMDVSLGVGAGSIAGSGNSAGGGMGAKMSPSAILIVQKDGAIKLINVKGEDTVVKVLDMVPDVIDRIKGKRVKKDKEVDKKVEEMRSDVRVTADPDDFKE